MCNEFKHWFINFDKKILNPKYKNSIEQKINYLFCLRDLFFEKRVKSLINITNLNSGLLKFQLLIFFLIPKKILK